MITLTAAANPSTPPLVLLGENFDETTNNWIKINNSSGGTPENAAWTLRPDGYTVSSNTFHSNDGSQFYMSNSDASGSECTTATILQSPEMSTIGYSSLSLSFWHHYRYYNGNESGKVEVSLNGTDWTEIDIYTSNQGTATAFVNVNLNLDSYINQSSFYVRFKYDATYDWWWVIDNVSITGTPEYLYSWAGSPSETAGLPTGAGTPASENFSVEAAPTATTTYTAYAQNPDGCIGNAMASVTVNPLLPVTVSIIASENPICTGTPVTFTATPVNGGVNPFYQWKVNGINIGINSPFYSSSALANDDQVTCEMTSDISCSSGNPATSNAITMIVSSGLPVSVNISASENPVCTGGSVTFTATPTNGGTSPTYQWRLNGSNVGTNSPTYTNTALANGNTVTCVMTSNAPCVSGSPATSNVITMEVGQPIGNNSLNLSSGNFGTICATANENINATITAPAGTYIAHVIFASYGTPNGSCNNFTYGACNAATSFGVTENYLLGMNSGVIPATNGVFGDPCVGTLKRLYIQVIYGEPICQNSSPGQINGTLPSGGIGTYSYLWEMSTTNATTGFSAAAGINNQQNYTPESLIQNTWFRRTVYSGGCTALSRAILIKVSGINTWTGNVSTEWNNLANWSCAIPNLASDITISTGLSNYPVLNTGVTGKVHNLNIESGASVIITANTLQIAGSIVNSGTCTATEGSIEMKGSSAQSIPANTFTFNTIKDLTISNPAGVTLLGELNVTGVVNSSEGNLTTGGHLTLISSPTQTALIDGSGNGEVLGNVTMQRYLPSGFGYKYFGSPFQAATVAEFGDDMDLTAAFPTFYNYVEDKESTGWTIYNDPSGVLSPFNGYCVNFGTNST
ncbi:MAG: hypothetical protein HGA37_15420, partial [Lentimicrobium sp.]|nr:hypothetical protein [Lentimicrobium sp.]